MPKSDTLAVTIIPVGPRTPVIVPGAAAGRDGKYRVLKLPKADPPEAYFKDGIGHGNGKWSLKVAEAVLALVRAEMRASGEPL